MLTPVNIKRNRSVEPSWIPSMYTPTRFIQKSVDHVWIVYMHFIAFWNYGKKVTKHRNRRHLSFLKSQKSVPVRNAEDGSTSVIRARLSQVSRQEVLSGEGCQLDALLRHSPGQLWLSRPRSFKHFWLIRTSSMKHDAMYLLLEMWILNFKSITPHNSVKAVINYCGGCTSDKWK